MVAMLEGLRLQVRGIDVFKVRPARDSGPLLHGAILASLSIVSDALLTARCYAESMVEQGEPDLERVDAGAAEGGSTP